MKLLIVESPAKAKTISKYLDDKYTVRASVGHVRDLPKSNKNAIDIPAGFVPRYEVSKGKEEVISELTKLAKKSDEVLLATDPDREGEAIAWHLKEILKLKDPKRVVFHEITKEAVQEAMLHPRTIDDNLRKAQEARRILDRLVGYDLSGLIWKKVRYGLSAGRVQSPALRIIMEREREIREFNPEDFWVITADVTSKKDSFQLTCTEEPKTETEADRICAVGKKETWTIKDVKETKAKRSARPPFITSTLQQVASTRLGYAPSRTMGIAQKLYEAGHITYMRTDSTNLSKQAIEQIEAVVVEKYGKEYSSKNLFSAKSKAAQEAHEAIRPSNFLKENAGNNEDQKKLYTLIWERTVASQMTDAEILRTKVTANTESNTIPDFSTNGSRVLFLGWLKADPRARGEDVELPKVDKGESIDLKNIHSEGKQTQPPFRYTEAGLIKELEKRGIGRPSTYASIMRTLQEREYVTKEGRTLFPTDTGDVVSSFIEKNFEKYVSDSFTAEMENELDEIAQGTRSYEKTLKDFYTPFSKDVTSKESLDKITTLGEAPDEFDCPKCKSKMVIKLGRGGKFMSCDTFPECIGARTIEGKIIEPDKPIGKHPETNEEIFLLTGRFGPYVQLGEMPEKVKGKKQEKPRRASVPKEKDIDAVTIEDAIKYLSLPRVLGKHPETNENIQANNGRFGPYVVHENDFRSLKTDDVYTIELPRALEIFAEEKKTRRRGAVKKVTKKAVKKAVKKKPRKKSTE
ncbi:MAG: type I DNA topoisomerase [Candidatus Paceibacterota bacterium]